MHDFHSTVKNNRSINVEANFVEETATTYQKYHYEFKNIDVILLEGIYDSRNKYIKPSHIFQNNQI